MQQIDIDYIGILDYLSNNQEIPYSNPEATGITDDEKQKLLDIEQRGKNMVAEMKKIASHCEKLYGLGKCLPGSWLDGSNTKTRKYLWTQMKYKEYADNPISISLFVEKNDGVTRYRISLEIKNDGTNKRTMQKYHSHMELPIEPGMVYVSGSNKWGNPAVISDTQEAIKVQIKSGALRKVQLCIYVEPAPDKTNEQYDAEIMEAVKKIIPYYEYVIGKGAYSRKLRDELKEAPEYMDLSGVDISVDEQTIKYDKNMILYGPPGTGKTYNTAIYAVAICSGKSVKIVSERPYAEVMKEYNKLKKSGRIAFTTFHQSYGYEEFIEGIKPVVNEDKNEVGYKIESGIFKKFCETARKKAVSFESENNKHDLTNSKVWCILLDGTGVSELKKRCFKDSVIRIGWKQLSEKIDDRSQVGNGTIYNILNDFQNEMQVGDIVVTQLTNHSIDGIGIITGGYEFDTTDIEFPRKRNVEWLTTGDEIEFLNINQGNKLPRKTVCTLHRITADIVLSLIKKSDNIIVNEKSEPYVFIIDEINRGNISKIFGELITLIENTKREGMEETASAVLPYSNELFSVPKNIYIIGTMNTADRSIALMDTALRRRFQFVEMMPDVDVLRKIGADRVEDLDVAVMLEKINERITFLYDREHTIGHAFFTKLAKDPSVEMLRSIFEKSVIPLLQEYFYEDYRKIQLILGDNGKKNAEIKFIVDEDVRVKDIFKGNADDIIDLPEKKFSINSDAFGNIESYKQIL